MNAAEIEELLIKLVQIPAPTGREQKRAEYITDWLKELGYHPFTDAAGNVIVEMKVQEGGYTVLMAHMDTVFEDVDISVVKNANILSAPGIGDDTCNAAFLMAVMKTLIGQKCRPLKNLLFVFDTGEEGLGNCRGTRQLMQDYKDKVDEVISFDLGSDAVCVKAVGSKRYRVTVTAPGGHSFHAFGQKGAIETAAEIIHEIYHNKTLIATFTDEQIINFKIKESELAHLLGVNMKKIVMNEKYVDLFNITPKEIEYIMDNTYTLDPNGSATIDVLHRIVDISNGNLLQFEEDRLRKIDNYQYQTVENNKDSLLNEYSKWNMRSKAFIDFKPLEELSLVLNFPEGYKIIKQSKDENPQHSLLISKNKLSEQFKYSTLVANYNKKQDRRYFQSLFLRKPNEFEQLQQNSIPAITTRVELSSDDGSGSVLRDFSRLEQAQFLKEIQNDFEKLDLKEVANYFHDMVYKRSLSIRKGF